MADAQGISVAFLSTTYDPAPFWIRLDDPTYPANFSNSNVVVGWETHRGRQYELDKTQAGTAIVHIVDTTGRLDPSNATGPYFGNIGPLSQMKVNVQNPVNGVYFDIFTGFTESWTYGFPDPSAQVMEITLNCTDGFEPLARAEVVPDATGTTTYAAQQVNARIFAALADAGWPAGMTNVFSGNVDMQETIYNPQTSILAVLQDAADAEFPNAANLFMDKYGNVAFRGRWARFNPSQYSADPPTPTRPIRFWGVGDRNAAETFNLAPIADIEWTLDLKNVINACLCTPYGIAQSSIAGQLKTNATSIAQYGTRVLSIPDLLLTSSIAGPVGPPPGGDGVGFPASDADGLGLVETGYIGQYYVDNYGAPVEMISSISFKAIDPTDSLGANQWKFLTGVEIGDVITVTETNPGGGGFRQAQFFVEGIHNVVTLGDAAFPQWTMNLDLTPRTWYSALAGFTYYTPPTEPGGGGYVGPGAPSPPPPPAPGGGGGGGGSGPGGGGSSASGDAAFQPPPVGDGGLGSEGL